MKLVQVLVMLAFTNAFGWMTPSAFGEASIFELRITNNSSEDLTFKLKDDHSKHARLTFNKKKIDQHTIKAGTSGVVGVQPTGEKCAPNCGFCTPTIGKVYAWYKNDRGQLQRNNYFRAAVEFSEYCGVAGDKPLTTYTSNWNFKHHKGKGSNYLKHTQSSSHNNYTKKDPAQGLTADAKYIKGQATIVYSDK